MPHTNLKSGVGQHSGAMGCCNAAIGAWPRPPPLFLVGLASQALPFGVVICVHLGWLCAIDVAYAGQLATQFWTLVLPMLVGIGGAPNLFMGLSCVLLVLKVCACKHVCIMGALHHLRLRLTAGAS